MNMQQRKYLIKKRIEPMKDQIKQAVSSSALRFIKYVSWGEVIRMIKSGELELDRKWYHKTCHSGSLYSSYNNVFGDTAGEILRSAGGVRVDAEIQSREKAEWEQRFIHAIDFLMLASEDTIVALLHNLEASVNDYCERAQKQLQKANNEETAYINWLQSQEAEHDYKT